MNYTQQSSVQRTVYIMTRIKNGNYSEGDYIPEWSELYTATLQFCNVLYKQRRDLNAGDL